MFIAAMHNGISRLYETFGNGGADTQERTVDPEDYARTWYVRIRPFRRRSGRSATIIITSRPAFSRHLHFFNENKRLFLKNFYLKSKRSVLKPSPKAPPPTCCPPMTRA